MKFFINITIFVLLLGETFGSDYHYNKNNVNIIFIEGKSILTIESLFSTAYFSEIAGSFSDSDQNDVWNDKKARVYRSALNCLYYYIISTYESKKRYNNIDNMVKGIHNTLKNNSDYNEIFLAPLTFINKSSEEKSPKLIVPKNIFYVLKSVDDVSEIEKNFRDFILQKKTYYLNGTRLGK